MVILAGNWWSFVIRGILAVLFGVMAFLLPGMALLTLVFLFGLYAVMEGVLNIIGAVGPAGARYGLPWWALLVQGIISIIAGLIALFAPGLTALALLYVMAAWAIVGGIMAIVAAIRLRKQIAHEWMLGLSGALSVLFGVLMFVFPGAGALAVILWIGAYVTVYGILLIVLGFEVRKWARAVEMPPHGFPPGIAPGH